MAKIITEHNSQKNYSYKEDDVTLTFSLKTDNKKSITTFKHILELALKEVTKDLDGM